MQNKKSVSYADCINKALIYSLKKYKNLYCCGLGINDPKRIFSTTKKLVEMFGKSRVFDTPTSENAITGVAIGASLTGMRSVVTHQRLDFFLLAMDQLVNSAAKWHYMFGESVSVPITIRLIIGRGWGQGPTHSQNLQAWFNHIPGLKVVMPTFPLDAKDLLEESIKDPNPVIFLEHRWLHSSKEIYNKKRKKAKIGKGKICFKGKDFTIISMSYLTIEAMKAAKYLNKKFNISCEVIDLRSIKPMDWKLIFGSVNKTKRVIVLDTGYEVNSVSSEIITQLSNKFFKILKTKPTRIGMPDTPEPTSPALTENYYTYSHNIVENILNLMKVKHNYNITKDLKNNFPKDVPDKKYIGPF
jgi:pyruvate/2-oxoglutarate/acetoin dehydrogenase E1 component